MEVRIEDFDSGSVTIPEEGNILIYKHAICLHLLMSILVRPSGHPARSSGVVNCPNMVLLPQKMFNIFVIARIPACFSWVMRHCNYAIARQMLAASWGEPDAAMCL